MLQVVPAPERSRRADHCRPRGDRHRSAPAKARGCPLHEENRPHTRPPRGTCRERCRSSNRCTYWCHRRLDQLPPHTVVSARLPSSQSARAELVHVPLTHVSTEHGLPVAARVRVVGRVHAARRWVARVRPCTDAVVAADRASRRGALHRGDLEPPLVQQTRVATWSSEIVSGPGAVRIFVLNPRSPSGASVGTVCLSTYG